MNALLKLEMLGFWHPGSGRGDSYRVDAAVNRDQEGLPTVPGRTLKGLLRDAVRRAEAFGWLPAAGAVCWENRLFGTPATAGSGSVPGLLRIGNARLPADLRGALGSDDARELTAHLTRRLYQTAIDEHGTARRASLRGIEVYVPLLLEAAVEIDDDSDDSTASTLNDILAAALPLADGCGAHRSRGLGRCRMTLEVL